MIVEKERLIILVKMVQNLKARVSCMTWINMGKAAVMKAETLNLTGAYQKWSILEQTAQVWQGPDYNE